MSTIRLPLSASSTGQRPVAVFLDAAPTLPLDPLSGLRLEVDGTVAGAGEVFLAQVGSRRGDGVDAARGEKRRGEVMDHEIPIPQWEYCRRVMFTWNEIDEMNRMGRDGWEVCGVWALFVYFKRPLR